MSAGLEMTDFSIRIVNRWAWIVVAGILGAVLGLLASCLVHPVYESSSVLAVSIDYGRTLPLELIVEDRALDRVEALLTSDDTLERVAETLELEHGLQEPWSDPQQLRNHIRLDSKLADWHLVGIAERPAQAAAIASAWSEVAIEQLDGAMEHAWKAARLQPYALMVYCIQLSQEKTSEFYWQCMTCTGEIDQPTLEALKQEIALSRGVLPILSYELAQAAETPARPVVGARAGFVISAALAGIICGVLLAGLWPERRR